MTRRFEERLLAFDPAIAWHAGPPKRPLVHVDPILWTPPASWDMTEKVALGLCSHGAADFYSAASLVRLAMADGAIMGPVCACGPLVHQTRRFVVEAFLQDQALGEFLLFIDLDTVVEPLIARKLATASKALQLDILSQTYATVAGTCEAAVLNERSPDGLDDVEEPAPGTVVEVDLVGFGCTLIRRRLLVDLEAEYGSEGRDFLFAPDPLRTTFGEDYICCLRARAIGARVATCNLGAVFHMKTVPVGLRSQAAFPALDGGRTEG